jgi:hypothetical protein
MHIFKDIHMKTLYIILLILIFGTITTIAQKKYKGAEYRTKQSFTYGRFEVSMKSSQREGMLSSFFTYYDGGGGSANWNEIDIEILGRYNNEVQFNTITPGQTNHVRANMVKFNPALDFHTYAIEWTPEYVAWFIDNIEVYRQTGSFIQTLTRPQKIMMNVWNPAYTNWIGEWNDNVLPAFAYYDWVSYYSYTPGSGNYGTGNNFNFQWKDDFNSWDQSMWEKSTHTWDGNNCDFIQENAVLKDGYLILCLTDDINIGFKDLVPPEPTFARLSVNKISVRFNKEIEKFTAEDKNNYIIPTINIDSVKLLPNQKSILLYTAGIDLNKNYTVITRNLKDIASPPNTAGTRSVPLFIPQPLKLPVKINVGGPDTNGYLADQEWKNEVEYGYQDGSSRLYSQSLQINGTDEDDIYHSERNGLVVYKIRVPNRFYNVKLMMAENYFTQNDSRIFDIYVEGVSVKKDLDIYKLVGMNTSYEFNVPNVEVKDEILEINLAAQIDNALLNGIVVEDASTGINENKKEKSKSFSLEQNYPNPFNGSTKIRFYLPQDEHVEFLIYDVLGRQIFNKNLGILHSGQNEIQWNSTDNFNNPVSSDIYFYCLREANELQIKKPILLK